MDHERDLQHELAARKAALILGAEGPIDAGVNLLHRHPYAVVAVAIGAGLLLAGRPRFARVVLALTGWGVRNLMRRTLSRIV